MKENNNPLVDKKVEDLLKPRYKVIADYPFCPFEVGEILYEHEGKFYVYEDSGRYPINPEAFPAVFKKLEWWEERKESEMPKYVKNAADGYIFELMEQSKHTPCLVVVGHYYEPHKWHTGTHSLYDLLPATLEEYLNKKQ